MAKKKAGKKPSDDEVLLVSLYNEILSRDPTAIEKSRWLEAMANPNATITEATIRYTLGTKVPASEEPVAEPEPLPEETDSE